MSVTDTITQMNSNTNQVRFEQSRENMGKNTISKDGFMQLLLAQLQFQSPLEPLDNAQFVSQQAQFAQVEKLDTLNETMQQSMQISQAAGWVGKNVEFQVEGEETPRSGRIDSVSISADGIGLQIGDMTVEPGQITRIYSDGG